MCLSAQVSLGAAAILIPAGAVAGASAWRQDRRHVMIATLPFLFGLQQLVEGLVWIEGQAGSMQHVAQYKLL